MRGIIGFPLEGGRAKWPWWVRDAPRRLPGQGAREDRHISAAPAEVRGLGQGVLATAGEPQTSLTRSCLILAAHMEVAEGCAGGCRGFH